MKKIFAILISIMLLQTSGFAVNSVSTNTEEEKPPLISIDFHDTSLYSVLNILSLKTGMKLITDTSLYGKKIMLSLKDVTPEEALTALLDTYNLYYIRQANTNIYIIKSRSDVAKVSVSKVVFCNYTNATSIATILKESISKDGKIVADARTNSLVITDLADSIAKMENLIRSIDVPTQQIMLEAKIVDVDLSKGVSLGTRINKIYRQNQTNTIVDVNDDKSGFKDIIRHSFVGATKSTVEGIPQTFASGLNNSFASIGVSILSGDWIIDAAIEAGIEDRNAKILTNPKLLVLNNQEANIEIVEEYPYVSSKQMSDNGTISTNVSFKDIGMKLKVKPQINRDGTIILQVSPEQNFRTGEYSTSAENTPIIKTSKTTTTLMLRSGETAAIGGMIRESEDTTINKIPLLGDIPILGYLFKSVQKNKTRYELTIFITAKIINN
ncbi:secretin N-terminal domain-containing protein [Candidatus Ruminimicrobium bovinum]|uniref:secretin N-terminal domain-containing protein n=1 Tax=Candidatus Ruminimicrobium bovinum TaxID=3242779 RepID=UPI0039B90B58